MRRNVRLAALAAAFVVSSMGLTSCNVAPPTGVDQPAQTTLPEHPTPTSVSCATIESELAYANRIMTEASKGFGDDPYGALDKIRHSITYVENLRDAAIDVRLEGALNEIAVEGRDLVDQIEDVMHRGTLLTEFHEISTKADSLEQRFEDLMEYCRF